MSLRNAARVGLVALMLVAVAAAAVARQRSSLAMTAAGVAALFMCLPAVPILALRWMRPRTSSMMRATRARLTRQSRQPRTVQFEWIPLEHVSREMWLAAIAAEDSYFREHSGFDWESIREAREHNRTHERKRGGSTITQQVAKNLLLWSGRSYVRKGLEAYLAVIIEALWPKRRILEVYLNIAQFDEDVFGVQAASRRHFGKTAGELTRTEAALLAAALPNPMWYRVAQPSHQMRFRQSWILSTMSRIGDVYLERL